MTVADDYQRECERVLLGLSWPIEDATEAAQALAADPGVRAAVEREFAKRAAQAIEEVGPIEWALYGQEAGQEAARIVRDLIPRKDGE